MSLFFCISVWYSCVFIVKGSRFWYPSIGLEILSTGVCSMQTSAYTIPSSPLLCCATLCTEVMHKSSLLHSSNEYDSLLVFMYVLLCWVTRLSLLAVTARASASRATQVMRSSTTTPRETTAERRGLLKGAVIRGLLDGVAVVCEREEGWWFIDVFIIYAFVSIG